MMCIWTDEMCVLAMVMQLLFWFIPAGERVTMPAFTIIDRFPAVESGWQCGGYSTDDDRIILATDWPCLAHLQRTVLHEWGHRVCWQTWGDMSEECAEAYARGRGG